MNTYDKGDLIKCTGTFTNSSGTAIDPAVVKFSVRVPAGTVTTYTYGTDVQLVKSSTGIYYVNVDAATEGTYTYRFFSTGTGQASSETQFHVKLSEF